MDTTLATLRPPAARPRRWPSPRRHTLLTLVALLRETADFAGVRATAERSHPHIHVFEEEATRNGAADDDILTAATFSVRSSTRR